MDHSTHHSSEKAPKFSLLNQEGKKASLSGLVKSGPVLLVFYPGAFTPVCTKQLCDYRDQHAEFRNLDVQVIGISADPPEKLKEFSKAHNLPFPLLSDPGKKVTKAYGCTSSLLFGSATRGIVLVSKDQKVLYRYVESTPITRRKSEELLKMIENRST
jgi:thioredoxin-dependent peroxiredoxin